MVGGGVRLARDRGAAQRDPAVHDGDRRCRDPLPARALAARGRAPARADARLARLRARVRGAAGAAHAAGGPGGCVPRRRPRPARLRLQRQAGGDRLGRGADRGRVGGADGAAGLRALRRGRERLGDDREHAAAACRTRRTWPGSTSCRRSRRPTPRRWTASRRRSGARSTTSSTRRSGSRATRASTRPARRRSATRWSTRRSRWRPGSRRSSSPGPTTTGIPRTPCRGARSSTR